MGIGDPFGQCEARAVRAGRQRVKERRDTRLYRLGRLQPITATQNRGHARLIARGEGEGVGAFRPLRPKPLDLVVRFLPIRQSRTPVTKHGGDLGGRAFVARNIFNNVADLLRHGVDGDVRRARDAQPITAEIVVHQVVAVPTAMILRELESEHDTIAVRDRILGHKDGLAILVATTWPGVDAPSCIGVAVDGKFDRAGDTIVRGFVVEVRLKLVWGISEVGGRLRDLHRHLVRRIGCVRGVDFEFRERAGAFEGAAGAFRRKIFVRKQFEAERANDAVDLVRGFPDDAPFGGRVTGGEH